MSPCEATLDYMSYCAAIRKLDLAYPKVRVGLEENVSLDGNPGPLFYGVLNEKFLQHLS